MPRKRKTFDRNSVRDSTWCPSRAVITSESRLPNRSIICSTLLYFFPRVVFYQLFFIPRGNKPGFPGFALGDLKRVDSNIKTYRYCHLAIASFESHLAVAIATTHDLVAKKRSLMVHLQTLHETREKSSRPSKKETRQLGELVFFY